MKVIGITGPTGAGKTTALRELEKLGGAIIDGDAVYHQLLESNIALQMDLEDRFGDLTDGTGKIQRKKLGAIVFSDPEAMADLNNITHGYIHRAVCQRVEEAERMGLPAAAIDAIRLFESGLSELCNETLAILAPAEVRIGRIMAREGISEEYARARVSAQHPDEFFTSRCGHILINDCDTEAEFADRARSLFRELLKAEF